MVKKSTISQRTSRLARVESKKMARQTYTFVGVTILLIALFLVLGIPALVRMAIFFGEMKSSSTFVETKDTIPPPRPQVQTIPSATSSATLSIEGKSEAGSQVTLFRNGNKVSETATDAEGNFSFITVNLRNGENRFHVVAHDSAGNESQQSSSQLIVFDTEAPLIAIESPENNSQYFGQQERLVTIVGNTDTDAQVQINDRTVVVSPTGNFSGQYQLEDGDNLISIVAVDTALNRSETTLNLRFNP